MHDIAIVGGGPAGLSAALTAAARGKRVLLISNAAAHSPLARAARIDNYPGLPAVSGLDLLQAMASQAMEAGVELLGERVISIMPMDGRFALTTGNDVFDAGSVVLAIGTQAAEPLPGELEYLGRGVSYCATCDGTLYRGLRVVVYGLSGDAADEANFLADIGCDVTFISPGPADSLGASIEARIGRLTAIHGDKQAVGSVSYRLSNGLADDDGSASGPTHAEGQIECQGVFVLRPAIAPATLVAGLETYQGGVVAGPGMATSIPGIFAAGDCVGKPFQIAKAVGEGAVAALSAVEYLR
jgi:thioredoxin reductase (NADPH)